MVAGDHAGDSGMTAAAMRLLRLRFQQEMLVEVRWQCRFGAVDCA